MKALRNIALVAAGGTAALMAVYWFNLDNKMIFYVVRPALNWVYDHRKKDVRL